MSGININPTTRASDVEKYLSKKLTEGVDFKADKVVVLGKIISNLSTLALTKFHRIQNLFETGTWINNNTVMKKLTKQVVNFNEILKSGNFNKIDLDIMKHGVGQMRAICDLLKDTGADKDKLEEVNETLGDLQKTLSKEAVSKVPINKEAVTKKSINNEAVSKVPINKEAASNEVAFQKRKRKYPDLPHPSVRKAKYEEKEFPTFVKDIADALGELHHIATIEIFSESNLLVNKEQYDRFGELVNKLSTNTSDKQKVIKYADGLFRSILKDLKDANLIKWVYENDTNEISINAKFDSLIKACDHFVELYEKMRGVRQEGKWEWAIWATREENI